MKQSEIASLTLTSAVKLIKEKSLSPIELVETLLDQIERTEPKIKAYTTVCREQAVESAVKADRELKVGAKHQGLSGIPLTIKDLIMTKGIVTTAGSKLLQGNVPDTDATVITRLKSSGASILGKSNTHEFALGGFTPPTRNPWNTSLSPGGSSGGSAAAVAVGSALAALGTDTGCSIRFPASVCGIVGLKPTFGRVSKFGVYPVSWSLDHVGPMTKTVEDAALLLNFISGFDPLDPYSIRAPVPDFTLSLEKGVKGMKLGIPKNYFFDHLEEGVSKCVLPAIEKLREAGADIVEFIFPRPEEILGVFITIDQSELSAYHLQNYNENKRFYAEDSRVSIESGFRIPAVDYVGARRARAMLAPEVYALFKRFDAIVCPTVPVVAKKPGQMFVKYGDDFKERLGYSFYRLTAPFNLFGLPSISVNCGFSSSLPVGLQIVGKPFDEVSILRVAKAYQEMTQWHKQHPPLG